MDGVRYKVSEDTKDFALQVIYELLDEDDIEICSRGNAGFIEVKITKANKASYKRLLFWVYGHDKDQIRNIEWSIDHYTLNIPQEASEEGETNSLEEVREILKRYKAIEISNGI